MNPSKAILSSFGLPFSSVVLMVFEILSSTTLKYVFAQFMYFDIEILFLHSVRWLRFSWGRAFQKTCSSFTSWSSDDWYLLTVFRTNDATVETRLSSFFRGIFSEENSISKSRLKSVLSITSSIEYFSTGFTFSTHLGPNMCLITNAWVVRISISLGNLPDFAASTSFPFPYTR